MALLEADNISIEFGGLKAVQNFNMQLIDHELFSIIGPNGAGKTTIFNMLTGIYKPSSGIIKMNDVVMNGKKIHEFTHMGIARTFQNIRLFGAASVLDNLTIAMQSDAKYGLFDAFFRTPRFKARESEIRENARELLGFFELDKKENFLAKNLPYGEQRKLEIARAMATHPKVLCLDEPAAGMNPSEVDDLIGIIEKIRNNYDITIILIEHHMNMVMAIADRIKVIEFGITIAEGKPDEIKNDPKVIEAYLGKEEEQYA